MNENINILISSKNRNDNDTSSSMMVKLQDDIYVNENEELYVNMTNFHSVKSFYACQTGLNDTFKVLFKIDGVIIETHTRVLSAGNYTIYTLMNEIKSLTNNALFDISYNSKLNKYLFKNLFQPTFDIYIVCVNSGIFFGFENNVEYKINTDGTLSSIFINVSGYTTMMIKITGNIDIQNTLSNIQDKDFKQDKILGIFSLTDIPPMGVIRYDNFDSGYNFRYKVNNTKIPTFNINIVNEDGIIFPQMTDWFMNVKFEKIKIKPDYMSFIANYLKDISYYVASLYSYMNIPSRITAEDLGI
jgi:hypothetical protein